MTEPETVPRTAACGPAVADGPIRIALHRLATLTAPGAAPARLERKQAALVAYLHCEGSTARGRLAGLLWPQANESGARANLRQCLARLRRIAPGVFAEAGDAIALAPGVVVDDTGDGGAEWLRSYDYADCDDFARWLRLRMESERAVRRTALATAWRAATECGDLTAAQVRADAMLALEPESEEAHRALMDVAYRRGDFAAAVRVWQRCRDMLRQLYGVAPSAATQALGATILAAASPAFRNAPRPDGATLAGDGSAATRSHGGRPSSGAARPAGNLAIAPPTLYGRTAELAELLSALRRHRLVTLSGIGGVGKTSLALAAAHAETSRWPLGAWFVDLAPVSRPAEVAGAIAHVLGIRLSTRREAVDALALALGDSEMLLVLDNAEHVWSAVGTLCAALLAGTRHLRLLVTSRRPLRVPEEQRFPLSGLASPMEPDPADLRQSGALALFEARAAALDPRFRLTAGNAAAVAAVCRLLDGLPLAIELAAARVPVLGIEALRTRLQQSPGILGARATIGPPRHQTLRATFDWTHDLLTPAEQILLRRLAVFAGGFTLPLAEQVTGEAGQEADAIVDGLGGLIDKSLVVANAAQPPRYRLLEVTRAYALEKLAGAGESERYAERHAQAILQLFVGAEADLNENTIGASSRGQFLRRVSPELDNLRAAQAWSRAAPARRGLAIGLAAASTEALRLLGLSTEALRTILEWRDGVDASVPADVAELFWTGLCAVGTHGRLSKGEMQAVIDAAERLYRRIGRPRRIHVGLYRKGFALLHLGDIDAAGRAAVEMEALEEADWPPRTIALRLNLQGAVQAAAQRFDASIEVYRRAIALLDGKPDESDVVLNVFSNLCMSLLGARRHEEALTVAADVVSREPSPVVWNIARRATFIALVFLERLDEARRIARQSMTGWRSDDMIPHMLSVFAWLAWLQGRVGDAVRLDGAARAQVARMGLSNSPVFDRARANLERVLGGPAVAPDDVSRWRREGAMLSEDAVVALCVGE